jgi:hypothetical protein
MIRAVAASVSDILRIAHETLDTTHLGYAVVRDVPSRRVAGLRNVVMFGAMVHASFEELRDASPEGREWYKSIRKKIADSVVTRLFRELHDEFRKRDAAGVSSQARLKTFNYPQDLDKLGKRPPRATELFMGDEIGGTGWEVELAPGRRGKYYVVLPAEYGSVDGFLSNTPIVQTSRDPRPVDIVDTCDRYVSLLDDTLRGAELYFRL